MSERISIDPAELRGHQASLQTSGGDVVSSTRSLGSQMARVAPGGAGGLDAEVTNQKYFDAATGLLQATEAIGQLLIDLGALVGKLADASDQQELARILAIDDGPNYDPKLWTRTLGPGSHPAGPVGPVIH